MGGCCSSETAAQAASRIAADPAYQLADRAFFEKAQSINGLISTEATTVQISATFLEHEINMGYVYGVTGHAKDVFHYHGTEYTVKDQAGAARCILQLRTKEQKNALLSARICDAEGNKVAIVQQSMEGPRDKIHVLTYAPNTDGQEAYRDSDGEAKLYLFAVVERLSPICYVYKLATGGGGKEPLLRADIRASLDEARRPGPIPPTTVTNGAASAAGTGPVVATFGMPIPRAEGQAMPEEHRHIFQIAACAGTDVLGLVAFALAVDKARGGDRSGGWSA
eukprot:Transcript_25350.p1 GENE.Transcript_25350~~Transcript_25350.p1  ORF type:complete len:280 (+),score=35.57 Transcript_25350:111-950(+)